MQLRSLAIAFFVFFTLAASAEAQVRVALLPLAVHASGPEATHLQDGLAEMIASRLDQYEGVRVVRPALDGAPPVDAAGARDAADASGADFVLYGSFTRFGDGASLDLRCVRVAGSEEVAIDDRRLFIQSGSLGQIIPQLDTLAQKVARYALATATTPAVRGEDEGEGAAASDTAVADFEALVRRVSVG